MGQMLLVEGAPKVGKCLGPQVPLLLHDGSTKLASEVAVGDVLMGPDSGPRNVLSCASGTDEMFAIIPKNSKPWVCNSVHMMTLNLKKKREVIVDLPLNEFLVLSPSTQQRHKLFHVPVDFAPQEISFDPYFIGAWLGDGTFKRAEITNEDDEVLSYLMKLKLADGIEPKYKVYGDHCGSVVFTGSGGLESLVLTEIRKLTATGEKRITKNYLLNSKHVRLQLLAGLIDTDGSYAGNGGYEITTQYPGLAKDIEFLARSLGFQVSSREKYVPGYEKAYYRLGIWGEIHHIPVKIPRKRTNIVFNRRDSLVEGFSVSPLGQGEYFGFTLDGDGRFLLDDLTVTHNTGALAALSNAGRIVRYLDFDNNFQSLRNYTKLELRKNIQRVPCLDRYGPSESGDHFYMTEYRSWRTMLEAMQKWPADGSDPQQWRNESVLVIDSLTTVAQARWRGVNILNARRDSRMMYKQVQDSIWDLIMWLKSEMRCPVIVLAHVQMAGPDLNVDDDIKDEGLIKKVIEKKLEAAEISQYRFGPISIGKAQLDTLPSLFTGVVLVEADEFSREIVTQPRKGFHLAVPIPGLPARLDISDGMERIMSQIAPLSQLEAAQTSQTHEKVSVT